MKVIQVLATSGGVGGLEQHTINLVNALSKRYEVHLIADAGYAHYLAENVHFHAFNFKRSRWNPFLVYELLNCIKQIQPQILHAQAGKAAAILSPWLARIPCASVATIHGMKNHLKAFMRFDHIIAVSEKIAKKIPCTHKVSTIYNGIHLEIGATEQPTQQSIHAIAVGRLVEVKGFLALVEAWQGIDAQLSIVGDGPQADVLAQKIEMLGLTQRVKLLGQRHDVLQLLQNSDCLIISSFKEGGPITLAEALLTQTPVLATDVGMVSAFLPPSHMCQNNNPALLNTLIQRQLADRASMQISLQAAFEKAQQHLHFEQMLSKTEALYLQLQQMKH